MNTTPTEIPPSDTPRTDALARELNQCTADLGVSDVAKLHQLARQLEKEARIFREAFLLAEARVEPNQHPMIEAAFAAAMKVARNTPV